MLAAGLTAVAPADAKRLRVTQYEIYAAKGTVRVSFQGSEAAGCRAIGVCGLSGTATYSFGGSPGIGRILWARDRKRTVAFYGFLDTDAQTVSDVVSAGSSEHCTDRAEHRYEPLAFEPRSRAVRFEWRHAARDEDEEGAFVGGEGDPFDTRCAGPKLGDLAGALPFADVSYRVFRSPRASFRTTGTRPFAGGGFAGSVEWALRYGLRHRGNRGGGFFAIPIG